MTPLTTQDVLSIEDFQATRKSHEARVLASRNQRQIALGDAMILSFENRLSVWWQVQEMCRVEGIRAASAVQHELDTYNALLPSSDALSATLLIGYADAQERDRQLRALVGLQHHLFLEIAGVPRIPACFDEEQFNEHRISSVQFLRFPLDPAQRAAFLDFSKAARFVVDHPAGAAQALLSPAIRGALVEDLLAD